jgi:hypothetical protein
VFAVGNTSWSREGKDPKSLGLIEASANIHVEVKTVKCSSSCLRPWAPLFIASTRATKSATTCHMWERRCVRAPVASMVNGMVPVLAVDLSWEGDVWFLYSHL